MSRHSEDVPPCELDVYLLYDVEVNEEEEEIGQNEDEALLVKNSTPCTLQ